MNSGRPKPDDTDKAHMRPAAVRCDFLREAQRRTLCKGCQINSPNGAPVVRGMASNNHLCCLSACAPSTLTPIVQPHFRAFSSHCQLQLNRLRSIVASTPLLSNPDPHSYPAAAYSCLSLTVTSSRTMPALETSSASPASLDLYPSTKRSPPLQSLEAFSASGTIPFSPLVSPQQQQQQQLGRPSSPPSYNTSVRHSTSPPAFSRTADIQPFVHPSVDSPLKRPSTSPASLASPPPDAFALAVELREAHQQLLIQKHAIAAALGAELTALKEERVRERRQHAMVMKRMQEEVKGMEERARMVQTENDTIRAELEQEKERREREKTTNEQIDRAITTSAVSTEQQSAADDDDWDERQSEAAALPVFHSQPPSSRPSITCPHPTRQSDPKVSAAPVDDDITTQQMLDVIQQLSQQIAAIRLQSAQHNQEHKQDKQVGEAEAIVYGPGHVWREYQPLCFTAVQPIVFHRKCHYTHYDVSEWGRK